ncbi:hypothetical protein JCM11641_003366 [Rhodosporidiobolus odoratus]
MFYCPDCEEVHFDLSSDSESSSSEGPPTPEDDSLMFPLEEEELDSEEEEDKAQAVFHGLELDFFFHNGYLPGSPSQIELGNVA